MIQLNNNATLLTRQDLILQTQELAARYPETGINLNKLAAFPFNHLEGIFNYLKLLHFERGRCK